MTTIHSELYTVESDDSRAKAAEELAVGDPTDGRFVDQFAAAKEVKSQEPTTESKTTHEQ